jgi:hypothetical protein
VVGGLDLSPETKTVLGDECSTPTFEVRIGRVPAGD